MRLAEAMEVAAELAALNEITEKLKSPDNRWELLQAWLNEHPEWKKRVNRWVKFKPEAAYHHLRAYICERAEIQPHLLKMFVSAEMEAKAKATIEVIQECYRERAGMKTEKARIENASKKESA